MLNSKKAEGGRLSIIVVNYRSEHYLKECIASIYNNLDFFSEVIVVNNDPEKNLKFIAKEFSGLKIINNLENIGFGKAVNLGAKYAQGEYLLFLNPDTKIEKLEIEKVFKIFEKFPEIAVISPRLIDLNGKTQEWICGFEINLWDLILNNLGFPRSRKIWNFDKKIFVHWVTGAAMFLEKKTFEALQGFDEKFFLYFEDIDFCKRARISGKKILYYPEVKIFHLSGGSSDLKKEQKKNYYQSQDYYFQKHFGKIQSLATKILRKITHV